MSSGRTTYRVLVADDEPQIASLIQQALELDGHFIGTCRDGVEAIRAVNAAEYSALILDNQMPRKTGVQVLLELRGRGDDVPVVLMSSFLSDEARTACKDLARVAFLQKPFGLAELRAALQAVVSVSKV